MNLPGIDLVEEGHHHKGVEHDGEVLGWRRVDRRIEATVDVEQFVTRKDECEEDGQLVNGMPNYVLHHRTRNQWTKWRNIIPNYQ